MYKHVARNLLVMVLVAGFFLTYYGSAEPAFACSCAPPKLIQEAFESSAAVFSGKVASIEGDQFGRTAIFQVDTAWKGVSKDTVQVLTAAQSSACGYGFEKGMSYIVYAHSGDEDSSLKANKCGTTTPIENALEHFIVLGAGYAPAETVATDHVVVDNEIDSYFLAIVGITGASAAVVGYVALRKRMS